MSEKKNKHSKTTMNAGIARTIQHYESMTAADIHAELATSGIDARRTIDAVKALVDQHRNHHGVHAPRTALRTFGAGLMTCAGLTATARTHAAAHQRGFFSLFDELAERLHPASSLDEAYLQTVPVTEAAIAISHHRGEWPAFAAGLARVNARWPVHVQCVLAHALRHWLTLGQAIRELATRTAEEVIRHGAGGEVQSLLHRDHDDAVHTPQHGSAFLVPAGLLDQLHGDARSAFGAMEVLDRTFFHAVGARQHEAVREWVLAHAGKFPYFLLLQSLACVRDHYPRFAAPLFAELAAAAHGQGRHIVFATVVEGYERSYGGMQQLRVPHFELGAEPHFVPGAHHDLDLFGHHVCHPHAAHRFTAEMAWANRRLALWS